MTTRDQVLRIGSSEIGTRPLSRDPEYLNPGSRRAPDSKSAAGQTVSLGNRAK